MNMTLQQTYKGRTIYYVGNANYCVATIDDEIIPNIYARNFTAACDAALSRINRERELELAAAWASYRNQHQQEAA
jgi:hypothetical protein